MNDAEVYAGSLDGRVLKDTVKRLERLLDELKGGSDIDGLMLLQAQAGKVATVAEGRTRRRAERVADKASETAETLRRTAGETEEQRGERRLREAQEALLQSARAKEKLLERLASLLHLVLYEQSPVAAEFASLRSVGVTDADGFLRIEIPEFVTSRSQLLVDGFDQSSRIFATVASSAKEARNERGVKTGERVLKQTAVGLVSSGAELRGLGVDCVPLVAYAFLVGAIPSAVDASDEVLDKVDDLVLGSSDEISNIPASGRPTFISMLRLAILLGEADAYAVRNRLTSLTFS